MLVGVLLGVLDGVTLFVGVVVGLGVNLYHLGLHTFPILIAALYITPIVFIIYTRLMGLET